MMIVITAHLNRFRMGNDNQIGFSGCCQEELDIMLESTNRLLHYNLACFSTQSHCERGGNV